MWKLLKKKFGHVDSNKAEPDWDIIGYYRELGVKIGENVSIISPISSVIFSSEPYLVSIGDNTTISFDVAFVTHDAATRVIRHLPDGNPETVILRPHQCWEKLLHRLPKRHPTKCHHRRQQHHWCWKRC